MARPVTKVQGYTSEKIHSLFKADDRYTIGLRLYAVYQVSLGQPSRKLEELYNSSYTQILNWVHRFEKEGLDGLRDKPGRGRHLKLNPQQLEELKEVITTKPPTDFGYNSATWTGPMLREWIKKRFNIEYKRSSIYALLKELGLSYQKSRGVYPETDKQKQEDFKEALKKTTGQS